MMVHVGDSDDPILANAIARRDAALAEARRWEEFIRMYREVHPGSATSASRRKSFDTRGSSSSMSDTELAAREIISAAGRPVSTRDMLVQLEKRGVLIGGKDPTSTLSARLSRSPSLVNQRPLGWALKAPVEEIGAAGQTYEENPADSDPVPTSSSVEPAAGGGT